MNGTSTILTLAQGWDSSHGGNSTFNRELSIGLAMAGRAVTARVSHPAAARHVKISIALPIPGFDDDRVNLLNPAGLPPTVDMVIGHSRFSGGAAAAIRAAHYPQASLVHFLHTSPELLGRLQLHPDAADRNAQTERALMAGADLVVGVGPLLAEEARRLARQCTGHPPPVHELIPGVVARPQPVYPAEPGRRRHILLFGRANEPLKGAGNAADIVRVLGERGLDTQLTVRGAKVADAALQERELSQRAGRPVWVKPFTDDQDELAQDLRGTDLVLVAALHEDFGLVATEAAGCGVPMLVGSHTGAGIFLSDARRVPPALATASVVPNTSANIGLWAQRAAAVLQDLPGERQRARQLQRHLCSTYTWKGAAAALVSAVDEHRQKGAQHRGIRSAFPVRPVPGKQRRTGARPPQHPRPTSSVIPGDGDHLAGFPGGRRRNSPV